MSDKILEAQVALACYIDRIRKSELGQGSAEYAGVIVIAVILVVALGAGAKTWGGDLGDGISAKIAEIFNMS